MKKLLETKKLINRKILIFFIIVLIILFSVSTVMLRGRLSPQTYKTIQGVEEIEKISAYRIIKRIPNKGFLEDFNDNDISDWQIYLLDSDGSLSLQDNYLEIKANFTKKEVNEAVVAYKRISVDLSKYPIFTMRIKAPPNVFYHIRFSGINSTGDNVEFWWETSTLDDRKGTGDWENISTDLRVFASLAAPTEQIVTLNEIRIIIDDSIEFDDLGNVSLNVDEFSFEEASYIIESVEQSTKSSAFHALAIKLSNKTLLKNPWNPQRITLFYEIEAEGEVSYSVYAFNKTFNICSFSKGPIFIVGEKASLDYYEITTFNMKRNRPEGIVDNFYGLIEDGLTLLFVSENFSQYVGFNSVDVKSIDIVYAMDGLKESISIQENYAFSILLLYFLLFAFLPIFSIVIIYKYVKSRRFNFSNNFVLTLLFAGLLIGLLLSFFTGHSYDMEIWTFHMRSYYESGLVTLESWPTMPFFYYMLLITYSPYALLRSFNINDPLFFVHPSRMLESFFIKSSLLVSGVISFIFIFKILQSYEDNKVKSTFLASLYLFGFLNIFVSAIWGMYDGIAVAFLLIGIYYGLVNDNYLLSIFAFSLSGLTKPFGFIGFIPLIIKLIRKKYKNMLLACFIIPIGLGVLLYIPILLSGGFSSFFELIFQRFVMGNAGLGIGSDISTFLGYQGILGTTLTQLIYPYFTIFLIGILLFNYILHSRNSESDDLKEAIKFMGLSFIIFYITGLRVYLQHYLWIIPIFILYSVYSKKKELIFSGLLISSIVAFIGPASVTSYGYFLFGAPYNMIKVISTNDASVLATSVSFLLLLSLIQIINPETRHLDVKGRITELFIMSVQFILIFGMFYAKQHSILSLSYLSIFTMCFVVVLLSPSSLSCIRSSLKKLRNIE